MCRSGAVQENRSGTDNQNMNKSVYTAAVIGTGRIGFTLGFDRKREQPASHTMALKANRRIRLIAGCDTDDRALEAWHRYIPQASAFKTCELLFENCLPDIVVVAVNEGMHLETVRTVCRFRPKLVILEKPVALDMEEGRKIAAAACSVPVLVNHERRFAADYHAAYDYMKRIGDLQSIRASLFSGLGVYSTAAEKTGAYSLLHDGTHLVDTVLYLLEAVTPSGTGKILRDPVVTGIYCDDRHTVRNASVHYDTGVCPDITFLFSGRSRYFGFEIDITGTGGRILIGNGYAEFYRREKSKLYSGFYSLARDPSVKPAKKTGYLSHMISNAVDFLDGTAPLGSTLENGLDALAVLDTIKERLQPVC